MRSGEIVVNKTETFKIVRSAADGGDCHMELELAPGAKGPPLHSHEQPEEFEILEGSIIFWLDGVERRFEAGDRYVIPPGCVHSFKNASNTERLRAVGSHGGRFERLIDQMAGGGPWFLRMALYVSTIDPRASYMANPAVRTVMRGLAMIAKLRGVRIVPPTGRYGVDG